MRPTVSGTILELGFRVQSASALQRPKTAASPTRIPGNLALRVWRFEMVLGHRALRGFRSGYGNDGVSVLKWMTCFEDVSASSGGEKGP